MLALILLMVSFQLTGRDENRALASIVQTGAAKARVMMGRLEPGKPIERELSGGQAHWYEISLSPGQFAHLVVDQRGIDVVVSVSNPDGKQIVEMDSPNGVFGPEPMSMMGDVGSKYLLEVRSLDAQATAGRYEVRLDELRLAKPEDSSRLAAERAYVEGERLRGEGKTASLETAVERFLEALQLARSRGDDLLVSHSLFSCGLAWDLLGDKLKALDYYAQALPLLRAVGDGGAEVATLNNAGLACDALGEKQKALDYYDQALPTMRAMGDRRAEAIMLSNIGLVYDSIGESKQALDYYDLAVPLMRALGLRGEEAVVLDNIGLVYASMGEMRTALECYDRALPTLREVGDRRNEALALNNVGSVYDAIGEKQKALDYYNMALARMRALGDHRGEATALNNIGALRDSMGKRQEALSHYRQALPLERQANDRRGEAYTLLNIGSIYHGQGSNESAARYYNQALKLLETVGDRRGQALALGNLGSAYYSLGQHQSALDYCERALSQGRYTRDRTTEATALYWRAQVLRRLGNLSTALESLKEAIDRIETTRATITSLETRSSYLASWQQAYDSYIDLLMHLDRLHPGHGYSGLALQASERARAKGLLETLGESGSNIRQGVDAELLQQERTLRQMLTAKTERQIHLLSEPPTAEEGRQLADEIDKLSARHQEIEAEIRGKNPRYASLMYPQPLMSSQIQHVLAGESDTLLLEYWLGIEHSYVWAVTSTSVVGRELPKRADIEALALRVYDLLTARGSRPLDTPRTKRARIAKADAEYPRETRRLSRMLLGPVARELESKRLLVVPDGAIDYLPFAALTAPTTVQKDKPSAVAHRAASPVVGAAARSGRRRVERTGTRAFVPLIVDHEIISLPSLSVLDAWRRELAGRASAPKSVAVLADPVFSKSDERIGARTGHENASVTQAPQEGMRPHSSVSTAGSRGDTRMFSPGNDLEKLFGDVGLSREGLERLPFTRTEAIAILNLVPAHERRGALDFEANRATALDPELGDYRYIHFATHAIINDAHPELSGIVLSLVDEMGAERDGFLKMFEVCDLKLSAELVTLSACRTGLGKRVRLEGLIGLTRGFMYAGAARVLVSLWGVLDNEATAELMERFYQQILGKDHLSPAAALRAAQIMMWRERRWQAPFYWASFVLQGEPN